MYIQPGWADQSGWTPTTGPKPEVDRVTDKRAWVYFPRLLWTTNICGTVERGYASSRASDVRLSPLPAWLITVVFGRGDRCAAGKKKKNALMIRVASNISSHFVSSVHSRALKWKNTQLRKSKLQIDVDLFCSFAANVALKSNHFLCCTVVT